MLFAMICTDKPDSVDLRMNNRPDHLAYLEGLGDTLKAGGGFVDGDGRPTGSLIVVEAQSRAEAEAIAAQDPYAKAGLFQSVDIRQWNWILKNPEG